MTVTKTYYVSQLFSCKKNAVVRHLLETPLEALSDVYVSAEQYKEADYSVVNLYGVIQK